MGIGGTLLYEKFLGQVPFPSLQHPLVVVFPDFKKGNMGTLTPWSARTRLAFLR